jgi:hypothetical protein
VAVFSCDPAGLWQVHVLHVRVQDHLTFEPAPDVAPLLELMRVRALCGRPRGQGAGPAVYRVPG